MTRRFPAPRPRSIPLNTIDDWPGKLPNEPLSLAMNALGDSSYFKTLGIPFVAGRNFTNVDSIDVHDVIINEAAVRRMRLKAPGE